MKKVLFLCTGNSCRSQMAEGFARAVATPVRAEGSEEEILQIFRIVRDELGDRVRALFGPGSFDKPSCAN